MATKKKKEEKTVQSEYDRFAAWQNSGNTNTNTSTATATQKKTATPIPSKNLSNGGVSQSAIDNVYKMYQGGGSSPIKPKEFTAAAKQNTALQAERDRYYAWRSNTTPTNPKGYNFKNEKDVGNVYQNVADYLNGGPDRYNKWDHEQYKSQLNDGVNYLNRQMENYHPNSKAYKTLKKQRNYYNELLSSMDRVSAYFDTTDYTKASVWHDEASRNSYEEMWQNRLSSLKAEMDATEDKKSDAYKNLQAYYDWYSNVLYPEVQRRTQLDSQFKDASDYTNYVKSFDYEHTNKLKDNIAQAQAELDDLLGKNQIDMSKANQGGTATHGAAQLLHGARETMEAPFNALWNLFSGGKATNAELNAAGLDKEQKARVKELEQNIQAWQSDLAPILSYQERNLAYNAPFDKKTDYGAIILDLKKLEHEAGDPKQKAELQTQIEFFENYKDRKDKINANLDVLQQEIDDLKDTINTNAKSGKGGENPYLYDELEKKQQYLNMARLEQESYREEQTYKTQTRGATSGDMQLIQDGQNTLLAQYKPATKLAEKFSKTHTNLGVVLGDEQRTLGKNVSQGLLDSSSGLLTDDERATVYRLLGKARESGSDKDIETFMDYCNYLDLRATSDLAYKAYLKNEERGDVARSAVNIGSTFGNNFISALPKGASYFTELGSYLADRAGAEHTEAWDDAARNLSRWLDYMDMRQSYAVQSMGEHDPEALQNFLGTGQSLGQLAVEGAGTVGNMAPGIILGALTGGAATAGGASAETAETLSKLVSTSLLGSSAAGSAFRQAKAQGYSQGQALTYGGIMGATEAASEYWVESVAGRVGISEGKLAQYTQNINNAGLKFAAQMGARVFGEQLEEYAQDKVEYLVNDLVLNQYDKFSMFDQDDWHTFVSTAFSTAFLELAGIPTGQSGAYNSSIVAEKYGKAITSKQAMKGNAEFKQAVNNAGKALGTSENAKGALLYLASELDPDSIADNNLKNSALKAKELAEGIESGKIKATNSNLGELLMSYSAAQGDSNVAAIKLLAGATAYKEQNARQDANKIAQENLNAVKAANPGAQVLDTVQSELKSYDGTLSLKQAQTASDLINQAASGGQLTAEQVNQITADNKTGRAIRTWLANHGANINATMTGEEAATALNEYIENVRNIKRNQRALGRAAVVQAAEEAATKHAVTEATQVNQAPTQERADNKTKEKLFKAQTEADEAGKALSELEGKSSVEIATEAMMTDQQKQARNIQNLKAKADDLSKQITRLRGKKGSVPSAENQAKIKSLNEEYVETAQELTQMMSNYSQPQAEAEVNESAEAQRAAFNEMTGVAKPTESGIIKPKAVDVNQRKADLAIELQNLLTEAAENKEISKAASIKKINPLIEELNNNGPSEELFAKINQVAEAATNAASHAALMNALKNWTNTFASVGNAEENVNAGQSAESEQAAGAPTGAHTYGDRGWGLRFNNQRGAETYAGAYSETQNGQRVVRYADGKHTVTASEDTELYSEANRPDLHKVVTALQKSGVSNVYYTNKNIALDGVSARGCFVPYYTPDGKLHFDIWVNADSRTAPVDGLSKHELGHGLVNAIQADKRAGVVHDFLRRAVPTAEHDEMFDIYNNRYREAYEAQYRALMAEEGATVPDEAVNDYLNARITPDLIEEEMFCDIMAGINAYGAHGAKFTTKLNARIKNSPFLQNTLAKYVDENNLTSSADSLRAMLSLDELGSIRNQRGKRYAAALRANNEEADLYDAFDTVFGSMGLFGKKKPSGSNQLAMETMLARYLAKQQTTSPELWARYKKHNTDSNRRLLQFAAATDMMLDLYNGSTSADFEKYFNSKGFSFYDYVDRANEVFGTEISDRLGEESADTTVVHADATPENTDSEGRKLTKKMADYMKDSYVRENLELDSPLTVLYRVDRLSSDVFGRHGPSWWHNDAALDSTYNQNVDMHIYDGLGDTVYGKRARAQAEIVRKAEMWRDAIENVKDPSANAELKFPISIHENPDGSVEFARQEFGADVVWHDTLDETVAEILDSKPEGFDVSNIQFDQPGRIYGFVTMTADVPSASLINTLTSEATEARTRAKEEARKGQRWRKDVIDLDRRESADSLEDRHNSDPWEKAMFRAYGNMTSPYIVDAKGKNFRSLYDTIYNYSNPNLDTKNGYTSPISTDNIVQMMKDDPYLRNMYDGIIFKNIVDTAMGGKDTYQDESGNVYVFFEPQQVKSILNWDPTSDPRAAWSLPEAEELLDAADSYVPGVSTKAPTEKQSAKYDATHFVKLDEMDNAGRALKSNALAVKNKLLRVDGKADSPAMNLYTATKYFGAAELDRTLMSGQDPARAEAILAEIRQTNPNFTPKGGAIYAVNDAYVAKTYANNKALGVDSALINELNVAEQTARDLSHGPASVLDGLGVESFDASTGQITDQGEYVDLCFEQGWDLAKNPYLDALQQFTEAQQQVDFLKQKIMLSSPMVMNSEDFVAEADPDTYEGWVDWMERHRGEVYSALDSDPSSNIERISFETFTKQAQQRIDNFYDTLDKSAMLAEMAFMKADAAQFSSDLMQELYDNASDYFDTLSEIYEMEEFRGTDSIFSSDVLSTIGDVLTRAEESEDLLRKGLTVASIREQTASLSAEESQFVKLLTQAYNAMVGDNTLSLNDVDTLKNVLAAPSAEVITFRQEGGYGGQSRVYLSGDAAFMNYAQKVKHTGLRDENGHRVIDGINNPGIYNYYLAPNNPLVIEFDPSEPPNWNSLGTEWGDSTREIELRAEAAGYDCVILRNITDFGPYEFDEDAVTAPYKTGADIIMIFDEGIIVPTEGRAHLSLEEKGPIADAVNPNPTTPAELQPNTYPEGSFENILLNLMKDTEFDIDAVNSALNELYTTRMGELARQNGTQEPNVIPSNFTPNMKPGEDQVIYDQLARLVGQFGAMEPGFESARNVIMPKKQSEGRYERRMYQSAANAKGTPDYMVPYIDKAAITDLAASYVRQHNVDAEAKARMIIGDNYERANQMWDGIASESHIPTSSDIALGELLFMQAAKEGQVNRAMKILADVAAMGTAAGQTVQAMSMIKKMTPAGQLYYLQQAVNRMNKQNEKLILSGKAQALQINQDMADRVFNAKTQQELDDAIEDIKNDLASQLPVTIADKWNAWRYLSMLGNPRTHIRNIFGNAVFMPARLVKDVIASGLESAFIKNPNQRTKNIGQALASSAGTASNLLGRRVLAGKQTDTASKYTEFANADFDVMRSVVAQSGKYNAIDDLRDRRQVFKPKALETVSRKNTDALEGEDAIFLKRAYVSSMAQFLAARNADVSALMDGSVESARLLNEARQHATLEAQKATYRDFSAAAAALNKMKKIPGLGTLVEGVLPFTKTPINILKRGIEYSPIGLAKAISADLVRVRQGKITAAQAIDNIAAGASGTIIAGLGVLLAHMGIATGKDDDDDKQAAFDALQGQQKYALNIGDGSYTIDWMAPVSLPFFVGVELYNSLANNAKIEMTPTNLYQSMMSVAEPILSLSMLEGLANVLSADDYVQGDAAKVATTVTTAAGSYIGQAVPTILGQLGRTIDGSRHATYIGKNSKVPADLQYFWQSSVQSKIPGYLSQKMDYVDEWGRKDEGINSVVLRAIQNFASPGYYRELVTTATDDELQRLADATGDSSVLPTKAAKYFSVNGEKKNLTADEYEAIQTDRGQTAYHLLTTLINDSRYKGLTDAEKAKVVSYYYKYANATAQYHVDNNYDLHGQGAWIEEAEAMANPYEKIWEQAYSYVEKNRKSAKK